MMVIKNDLNHLEIYVLLYTVDHAESCRRARQISLITVVVVFDTVPEARKHANSL